MDALKFFKEWNRMCSSSNECAKCPFNGQKCDLIRGIMEEHIAVVEQWSQEHPRKTRQDVFLEQWPNCMIDNDGVVGICPRNVDNKCICNLERSYDFNGCLVCRRKFWMQKVE